LSLVSTARLAALYAAPSVTVTPRGTTGTLIRCNDILCGLQYQNHVINIENAMSPDYSSVTDIKSTDAAIWLRGLTLTRVP